MAPVDLSRHILRPEHLSRRLPLECRESPLWFPHRFGSHLHRSNRTVWLLQGKSRAFHERQGFGSLPTVHRSQNPRCLSHSLFPPSFPRGWGSALLHRSSHARHRSLLFLDGSIADNSVQPSHQQHSASQPHPGSLSLRSEELRSIICSRLYNANRIRSTIKCKP